VETFKQPTCPYDIESIVDWCGLTREVETPLPSHSPHDHLILRGDLVAHTGGGNALAFKQPT
jgi:hypothetical protein